MDLLCFDMFCELGALHFCSDYLFNYLFMEDYKANCLERQKYCLLPGQRADLLGV